MATVEIPIPTGEPEHGAAYAGAAPYIWQPPGNQRRISIELDVVDRILQEALRGLGSVPKRGAEIGGVLLGALSEDGTLCITGNVPVHCSHAQGSSYTLSHEEYREFAATVARCAPSEGRPAEAIGFYRSHTREGLGLSMDDVRVFDALFPGDLPVILLVKPFATRVSQAAFFFREEGGVQREASYLEFPFRRRELGGDEPGRDWAPEAAPDSGEAGPFEDAREKEPMRSLGINAAPVGLGLTQQAAREEGEWGEEARGGVEPDSRGPADGELDFSRPGRTRILGRRWALIPLSFLFLLLGLFLGIQVALTLGPRFGPQAGAANPYTLGLRVTQQGQSLQLDWNRSGAAAAAAQDATLYIEDGGVPKVVPLTRDQVATASIVYPPASSTVRFRLDVRLGGTTTLSESVVYNRR